MKNPYEILGISQSANDDEIKSSYRELAKKYHPDNYSDSPLKEFADEKMKEINKAFDDIMNTRRANPSNSTNKTSSSTNNTNSSNRLNDIRALIQANRLVDAEEILDGIPINNRGGEWYFLKGTIYHSRGWLEDALNHFTTASRLEPNNTEYRATLNKMSFQRQGNFNGYGSGGGYRQNPYPQSRGCTGCDMCQGLICADCCCECMGGDCISCC